MNGPDTYSQGLGPSAAEHHSAFVPAIGSIFFQPALPSPEKGYLPLSGSQLSS